MLEKIFCLKFFFSTCLRQVPKIVQVLGLGLGQVPKIIQVLGLGVALGIYPIPKPFSRCQCLNLTKESFFSVRKKFFCQGCYLRLADSTKIRIQWRIFFVSRKDHLILKYCFSQIFFLDQVLTMLINSYECQTMVRYIIWVNLFRHNFASKSINLFKYLFGFGFSFWYRPKLKHKNSKITIPIPPKKHYPKKFCFF